tara:strand:+ start:208 stop:618 length:411 start_codon:yes stop_codon:yes gene_type:complete
MHRYIANNLINNYEIFSKIDCDSVILVNNLKEFVTNKGWNMVNEDHYFGHVLHHQKPDLVSGPATFFSRSAMRKLGRRLQDIPVEIGDRRNFKHGRCVVSVSYPYSLLAAVTNVCLFVCFDRIAMEQQKNGLYLYV